MRLRILALPGAISFCFCSGHPDMQPDAERGDGAASRDESAGVGQVSGRDGELLHNFTVSCGG
ncbi:MAG: hypothetical protein HDR94_02385 [Bacteroides sp.]|nr:hypothetical protein [Bacteroides sp.]